jgi:hypothetical protein
MSFAESKTTREGAPQIKSIPTATLIEANRLDYTVPPSLSVVVQRRHVRNEAQSVQYRDGRTCNIALNSGDDYCNGRTSYFTFKFETVGAVAESKVNFGSGSALNVIKTLTMYHSAGTEMDRLENHNLYQRFIHKYTKSSEYFCTVGSCMGYSYNADGVVPADNTNNIYEGKLETGVHTFVIPMSEINGMFDTDQLIPSYALSGMRLSIDLAHFAEALVCETVNSGLTGYTISECAVVLDVMTLSDNIVDKLNQLSGSRKSGTQFYWNTYDSTPKNITQGSLHVSAEKAVSRASKAFCIARRTADVSNILKDSMIPEALTLDSYQFRLGSSFFPNKTLNDHAEMYFNTLFAFDNFHSSQQTCVPFKDFKQIGAGTTSESGAVVALERSENSLSGLPISGSRALTLDATFTQSSTGNSVTDGAVNNKTIDMFLIYTKVASCYLYDRIVLKE